MLRLVHPATGGQGTNPPRRRKAFALALQFTPQEAHNVTTAIRGAARVLGGFAALARALGVHPCTLNPGRPPSPGLTLAVARHAGLSLDAMLSGKLTDAGRCPTCGAAKERAS